jgi:hypothetical protein
MELADRFLGGPFRGGKSIADVVASGEMDPEDNAQLANLFRMCRERVVKILCYLLFIMEKPTNPNCTNFFLFKKKLIFSSMLYNSFDAFNELSCESK